MTETYTTNPAVDCASSAEDTGGLVLTSGGRRAALLALYALWSMLVCTFSFFAVLLASAHQSFPWLLGIALLLGVTLVVFAETLLRSSPTSPELAFFVMAMPALTLFSWFILPDQVPDEVWHIYRSLNFPGFGNGDMVAPAVIAFRHVPTTYQEYLAAILSPTSWEGMSLVTRDMSAYLPHLYLFSGIMAAIGKCLGLNVFVVIWMARMGNVLAFLIAGYWVLRLLPVGKTVGFVYLLNPMLLELEASCSADAVTNCVTLVFIASYLRCFSERPVTRGSLSLMLVSLLLTCLSKYAYAALAFLLIAFLPRVRGTARRRTAFAALTLGLASLGTYVLLFYSPAEGGELGYALDLIRRPLDALAVYLRTIWELLPFWVSTFAGGNLGALTISVWPPCLWAYLVLLALSIVYGTDDDFNLPSGLRRFHVVFSVFFCLVLVLPFRKWSIEVDARSDVIQGVQGRYFLPFALLPLVSLVRRSCHISKESCYPIFGTVLGVIVIIDMASIMLTYI